MTGEGGGTSVEEKCGVAYRFATNPAGVQSRQQPLHHKNTQGQLEGVRGGVIPEEQRHKNTQGQLEGARGRDVFYTMWY
jgi:hypothetical protein